MESQLCRLIAGFKRKSFQPHGFRGNTSGYRIARSVFLLRDRLKKGRRTIRQYFKSPTLARRSSRFKTFVARQKWDDARREALEIASIAETQKNARIMEEIGFALLRLGEYRRSGELFLHGQHLLKGMRSKEWDGGDLSGRTLLIKMVESGTQGLSSSLQNAKFIPHAAAGAKHCIVLAEPRLVSLLRRSFPDIDIRPSGYDDMAAEAQADAIATVANLRAHLATDPETIAAAFTPLRADPLTRQQFRELYSVSGKQPLVGISWGSVAFAKEVPPLTEWARFLQTIDANFISLQYGGIEADLEKLRTGHTGNIIHDISVDQLVDMDRFAAQVAATDAVVTISNTAAHLAGALGMPTIVISDDNFRRFWPVMSDTTPWYPSVQIVRKKGRAWNAVVDEVQDRLKTIIDQ